MSKEFFDAVKLISAEKGIDEDYLYEKIAAAVIVAAKHDFGGKDIVHCDIDPEKQKFKVYVTYNVVEEVNDPLVELTLEQAQQIRKSAKVGGTVDMPLKTKNFGRIVAQTAKHVIRQGIREAERSKMMEEFRSKNQELISAKVDRIDPETNNVTLEIGKNAAILPRAEQLPGEHFTEGETIKVFVVDVRETSKGPKILISRTHPGMVRRLFEQEVPEIYDGTIEIKSVSREAGSRTKISVYSSDENVDPVGSCIGPRGQRVSDIVDALGGEKIDVIKYSDEPSEYIAAALAPATVCGIEIIDEDARACRATVPDDQLSLAIGNKGQNVRLAARLTGWKIDIRPKSGFYDGGASAKKEEAEPEKPAEETAEPTDEPTEETAAEETAAKADAEAEVTAEAEAEEKAETEAAEENAEAETEENTEAEAEADSDTEAETEAEAEESAEE